MPSFTNVVVNLWICISTVSWCSSTKRREREIRLSTVNHDGIVLFPTGTRLPAMTSFRSYVVTLIKGTLEIFRKRGLPTWIVWARDSNVASRDMARNLNFARVLFSPLIPLVSHTEFFLPHAIPFARFSDRWGFFGGHFNESSSWEVTSS